MFSWGSEGVTEGGLDPSDEVVGWAASRALKDEAEGRWLPDGGAGCRAAEVIVADAGAGAGARVAADGRSELHLV